MKQPEEDPQLENMQQLELALARLLLNLCLHLKIIVAVPQPAVHLNQHGRAQEKQQQEAEVHVGTADTADTAAHISSPISSRKDNKFTQVKRKSRVQHLNSSSEPGMLTRWPASKAAVC